MGIGTVVTADPTGLTSVPGVWVAGDAANPVAQINGASTAGTTAGAMINADLAAEDAAAAVAAARARPGTDPAGAPVTLHDVVVQGHRRLPVA